MSETAMKESMRRDSQGASLQRLELLDRGQRRRQAMEVDVQRALDRVLLSSVLDPTQFEDIWHRSRARSSEQLLAKAVVEQAFADLVKYRTARRRRERRLYREAYDWIASPDQQWPYSFVNLCELLGLSAAALREQLLERPARNQPAAA
jgi:hypothetical protein